MSAADWHKDPDEILDFTHDLSVELAGDTITESAWTIPAGISLIAENFTPTGEVIVRLAGGLEGAAYRLRCTIGTAAKRTIVRAFELFVATR